MGTLNDVVINKLSGGLGRRNPDQDMVSGLLFDGDNIFEEKKLVSGKLETTYSSVAPSAPATPYDAAKGEGMVQLFEQEKLYRLASVEDAEALGIDADYDSETQSAHYQIEQFFRMNPSGDLFIMGTKANEAVAEVVEDLSASPQVVGVPAVAATAYNDVVSKAKAMQEEANGAIRQMAVIFSGTVSEFGTVQGESTSTTKAVQAAQTEANNAYKDYMPFEIILEGKKFDVDAAIDLKELNAENVSVVVAMDAEKAKTYTDSAAVGMVLGAVSKAKVSENIAWIQKFNVSGEGFGKAAFVGGKEVKTIGTLNTLNDSKYIFARTHTGLPGVYFNDSHTCTLGTSDFTYIENNRTINKAVRLLRTALLPRLAMAIQVNSNGNLQQSVTKSFENLCRAALEGMVSNQEVSAFDVYVDPKQNILATSELKIKAEVTPVGTARRISVDLGFKNPFGVDKA